MGKWLIVAVRWVLKHPEVAQVVKDVVKDAVDAHHKKKAEAAAK